MKKLDLRKKMIRIITLLVICASVVGCSRTDSNSDEETSSGNNYLSLTQGTKTYKTIYDANAQLPTKSGTFTCQYEKYSSSSDRYRFWAFVDNKNDFYLDVLSAGSIELNRIYKGGRTTGDVKFNATISDESIYWSTVEIVFTSGNNPGRITGKYKVFDNSKNMILNGELDFVRK